MKDAALLDKLRSLKLMVDDLYIPQGATTNRIRKAQIYRGLAEIIAALEANPPLAEVEGWAIEPKVWREARDVTLWSTAEEAESEECEDGAILVTVTIRERR